MERSVDRSKFRAALMTLAQLDKSSFEAALREILAVAAELLDVSRVGFWELGPANAAIHCRLLYDRDSRRYEEGGELRATDFPAYFAAMLESRAIVAHDAWFDPRTRKLVETYLGPHGIRSMLDVPVWRAGKLVGVLCHEHVGEPRTWLGEEQDFCTGAGNMVSVALEAQDRRRAEERFALVGRATTDALYDWDIARGRIEWSEALDNVFGHAAMQSSLDWWTEQVHPDDRATVEDTLSKLLSASETRLFAQYRWRRGDGSYATVRDSGVIVRDARGEAVRVVGTLVDISERVQLEARVALSDRMASIGTLAAGVAHEINNPLTYVMANVDLAIDALHAGVPTHDLLEMLREAREGCTRVSRVVHDLGVFSRPREDEETLEITQVIDSAIKMSWNHIRHRAQLVRDHGPTPRVQMNRSRLGQVILNLLVNAAQAIVDGNATQNQIRIRTATELDGRALIEITDTGPGIPPHVLGHIFEPFFTTKPVGAGTGLGLSICHTIITAAGGHIDIASGASGGCTVRVTLPAARTVDKPVAALPLAAGRKRILLVDDEPSIRRALRRMLEHTNDVEVAESGEQALEKLLANDRFDIIFCDLMMPTMSGIDLYERLLADCAPLAERMVFMTGGAFSERSREFLADCGRPIVEKPFDRQTIDRVISAVAQ